MGWIQTSSSNIERFRYDPTTCILEVEFKGSSVYQYFDVPSTIYDDFVAVVQSGGSAGQYLNTHIKGVYRYSRV